MYFVEFIILAKSDVRHKTMEEEKELGRFNFLNSIFCLLVMLIDTCISAEQRLDLTQETRDNTWVTFQLWTGTLTTHVF